jgi:hypothetical protein
MFLCCWQVHITFMAFNLFAELHLALCFYFSMPVLLDCGATGADLRPCLLRRQLLPTCSAATICALKKYDAQAYSSAKV